LLILTSGLPDNLGYLLCGVPICVDQWGAMGEAILWNEESQVLATETLYPLCFVVLLDGLQVWTGVRGLASLQHTLELH
jgi:hypothetical protein